MTCPVYHQWVSELKASVMRCGKREPLSLTNIIPVDTGFANISREGESLVENNSYRRNLGLQSKHSFLESFVTDVKNSIRVLETIKACASRVKMDPHR